MRAAGLAARSSPTARACGRRRRAPTSAPSARRARRARRRDRPRRPSRRRWRPGPARSRAQDRVVAERRDDARPEALPQPPDRLHVHVVVVVVGDQHGVDLRQVVEGDAGRIDAPGPDEREGAHPLGPHRIDQHVAPARLDQERGVADEGDAHALAVEARRRAVGGNGLGKLAGHASPRSPSCHFRNAPGPLGRDAARIEEAHAVEMVRSGPLVVGVGAPARQQRPAARTHGGAPLPASAAGGGDWASSLLRTPTARPLGCCHLQPVRALPRAERHARDTVVFG